MHSPEREQIRGVASNVKNTTIMQEISINKQIRLSEHFTLGEMTKTSIKTADGNIPSHVHIENLKRVCGWLERLRQRCNLNKKEKIKNKEIIKEDNNYKIRRVYTQYNGYNNNFNKPGLSIKERIKIFEGEFNKNKIYKNENIPGKLKIPDIFLESNKKRSASKDDKENKNKKENE